MIRSRMTAVASSPAPRSRISSMVCRTRSESTSRSAARAIPVTKTGVRESSPLFQQPAEHELVDVRDFRP